jgi:hypothetical protein
VSSPSSLPTTNLSWLDFFAERDVEYSIGVTTWSAFANFFYLYLDGPEATPESVGMVRLTLPPSIQPAGQAMVIETSTNLIDWVPFTTLPPGQTEFQVAPKPNEPQRFFRRR